MVVAGAVLVAAALVGTVAALRIAVAYVRLRRLAWPDASPGVQARAAVALRAAGVRRPVRVVSGGTVSFTFGGRRPVIAVPPDLGGEALDFALAHEAAHVAAGDFAAHLALSAVAAPFAAHPLVGAVVRAAALDRERLADAAVLAERPAARRAYGHLLVSFADRTAPRLALGAAPGTSPLLHRLTAMTRLPSPSRVLGLRRAGRFVAALTLAAVAVGSLATSAQAPLELRHFRLMYPAVVVDGIDLGEQGSRFDERSFRFLTLTMLGYGRFVVSDQPFEGAVENGHFDGARLDAEAGGHTLSLRAEEPMIAGGERVPAYLRFDPAPEPQRPVRDAGLAIGLRSTLDHLGSLDPAEHARELDADVAAGRVRIIGNTVQTPPRDSVYDAVDEMPEMVGGVAALAERLVYPEAARADGAEGTTFVQFIVSPAGAVYAVRVTRSSGDARLDAAAVEAVRTQPFTLGRLAGRAVAVRLVLPVRWVLPPAPPSPSNPPSPPSPPSPPAPSQRPT